MNRLFAATKGLPRVAAALAGVGMLMGASPDVQQQLPMIHLTGNPALDAAILAGVIVPGSAFAAWLAKTFIYATGRASGAGMIAVADYIDHKQKKTDDPSDDLKATFVSTVARSFGGTLCDVFKAPPKE